MKCSLSDDIYSKISFSEQLCLPKVCFFRTAVFVNWMPPVAVIGESKDHTVGIFTRPLMDRTGFPTLLLTYLRGGRRRTPRCAALQRSLTSDTHATHLSDLKGLSPNGRNQTCIYNRDVEPSWSTGVHVYPGEQVLTVFKLRKLWSLWKFYRDNFFPEAFLFASSYFTRVRGGGREETETDLRTSKLKVEKHQMKGPDLCSFYFLENVPENVLPLCRM